MRAHKQVNSSTHIIMNGSFYSWGMPRKYSVYKFLKPRILVFFVYLVTWQPFENRRGKILFTRQKDHNPSISLHGGDQPFRQLPAISRGRLLYPQPENAPCRGNRDPCRPNYGTIQKWIQNFRKENLRVRYLQGDRDAGGRIILK